MDQKWTKMTHSQHKEENTVGKRTTELQEKARTMKEKPPVPTFFEEKPPPPRGGGGGGGGGGQQQQNREARESGPEEEEEMMAPPLPVYVAPENNGRGRQKHKRRSVWKC